ncbi:MAG: hypothetical protein U9R25_05080 [Chloroflexota bacterium]|nr:hypothetical protein [Chloroflexota bacterium]
MSKETSASPVAADVESLKSQVKALKEAIRRLELHMEEIEEELASLRNLI